MSFTPPKDCYCPQPCLCAPCKVCGESWTSNDDGLCRDCNIDGLMASWAQCPCGMKLFNPSALSPQPHTDTCPHAETGAYDPVPETDRPLDPLVAEYVRGFRAGQMAGRT